MCSADAFEDNFEDMSLADYSQYVAATKNQFVAAARKSHGLPKTVQYRPEMVLGRGVNYTSGLGTVHMRDVSGGVAQVPHVDFGTHPRYMPASRAAYPPRGDYMQALGKVAWATTYRYDMLH